MTFRLLSREEFEATLSAPMRDATADVEEAVDIWPYVDALMETHAADQTAQALDVAHVYETPDGRIHHVLIPLPADNHYLVVVVLVEHGAILGHHLLDLDALYGRAMPPGSGER